MKTQTSMRQLIKWVATELKLDGYEHQVIIDKAESLLEDENASYPSWTPERGDCGIDNMGSGTTHTQHVPWDNNTGVPMINYDSISELKVEDKNNEEIALLDDITFRFDQDANCVDGGEVETITIEAKSSLGIDRDGGAFYVIKTEQWAFSNIEELVTMLKRVEAAVEAMNPSPMHK